MKEIKQAIDNLNKNVIDTEQSTLFSFEKMLYLMVNNPTQVLRNVFQIFHDMVKYYVGEGNNEYPDDPESIGYISYDCNPLFVENSDHPFFADRLFANRLIALCESFKRSAQQNKIYVFEGPPGSGKSTFLNNLLLKFEEYTSKEEGIRYETVWKLDQKILGGRRENKPNPMIKKLVQVLSQDDPNFSNDFNDESDTEVHDGTIEISCPSHDHPIVMIPKAYRRAFLDDLFQNNEIKWKLFTEKEYEWIFRETPCTICSSLFEALLDRLQNPNEVFKMIYARPYRYNRRLGEGITVYNPGDKPMRKQVLDNPMIQKQINRVLMDSNRVKYIFSTYAKTNNGIYALMDIKSHNKDRLIELHNIVSEGLHKVEDLEENVNSLFISLMNPEDHQNISDFQSFSDRIEIVNIPYILDWRTEVEIYHNIFGKHISNSFLPRVLNNFARVIISTRMQTESPATTEWIDTPSKYNLYCDENLQLLRMEIYAGVIPSWLSEDDRKRFTAKRRRKILAESDNEGSQGFSGRDSIKIFNEFYSNYSKDNPLINMSMLFKFFLKYKKEQSNKISESFLHSLLQMYNYMILQEVKESLYDYNEEEISKNIKQYIFATNFEPGTSQTCPFTGEEILINEEFFFNVEDRIFGVQQDLTKRYQLRDDVQKEYTSKTLTQEMIIDNKKIIDTKLYASLHERYVHNLKEKVLDPFLENENFRRAIKDYDTENFKAYDKRIRHDITFLIQNLCNKFAYSERGAKEVCIYVIDNDIAKAFGDNK
ncbi:ATPase AAA [Candidatus Magnetomorum sp. HK-1]|nr:ATPase AAA [Candidatus Magnetomorum sp. HK-1]